MSTGSTGAALRVTSWGKRTARLKQKIFDILYADMCKQIPPDQRHRVRFGIFFKVSLRNTHAYWRYH